MSVRTHQINELREAESELDQKPVRVVGDRPDESVVVAEEVIVESLGIRVSGRVWEREEEEDGEEGAVVEEEGLTKG